MTSFNLKLRNLKFLLFLLKYRKKRFFISINILVLLVNNYDPLQYCNLIFLKDFAPSTVRVKTKILLTPQLGLEPRTNRLTADRSTTELLKIVFILY